MDALISSVMAQLVMKDLEETIFWNADFPYHFSSDTWTIV